MDIFKPVPINQIYELQRDPKYKSRVHIDSGIFPDSMQDKVSVRPGLMDTLCGIAGLSLNIKVIQNGQIARTAIQMNGSQNGEGTASGIGVSEEINSYDSEGYFKDEDHYASRQKELRLSLNRRQIEETARDKGDNDRFHPGTWQDTINDAIRKTITKGATENLTENIRFEDWFQTGASTFGGFLLFGLHVLDAGYTNKPIHTEFLGPSELIMWQFGNIGNYIHHKKSGNPNEFRWSLINGPQYDRDLLVKAMCGLTHLAPFVEIKQES